MKNAVEIGLKKEKVPGGYRKLHNVKFVILYMLPDSIKMNKSGRMRG